MKKLLLVISVFLAGLDNANAQHPRAYQTRPNFQGYYNGRGVTFGYSYNPYTGWNTIRLPNGTFMDYRDGYIPPRYPVRRHYYYNSNQFYSYSDLLGSMMYP